VARRRRTLTPDEQATIAAFVVPDRQSRVRLLLARGEIDDSAWSHHPPLKACAMSPIPGAWAADDLVEDLRRRGAPDDASDGRLISATQAAHRPRMSPANRRAAGHVATVRGVVCNAPDMGPIEVLILMLLVVVVVVAVGFRVIRRR
jgi:hypothetical protein